MTSQVIKHEVTQQRRVIDNSPSKKVFCNDCFIGSSEKYQQALKLYA